MRKKYIVFTVLVLVLGLLSHASQNTFAQEDIPKPTKISLERLQSLIEDNPISATSLSDLSKLDSHLMDLVSSELSGADIVQTAQANDLQIDNNQKVLVDVYINGDLDQSVVGLQEMGMLVLATNSSFGVVEGYLPVSSILSATSLEQTKAFLPITMFGTDTGSVTSEGDASHNGPAARALGPNGSGVVVGVISDSMNQVGAGLSGSQGSGDLPAGVTVLLDDTQYVSDEGRAMAEIIYDTAPGITSMFFHSGTTSGPAGKAAAINNLVSSGADIIADDIYYLTEPFFQDGMVADAVDAAYASGVAYFASAGNRADQSYEAYYQDWDGWHDFDSGAGQDWLQTVATIPNGSSIYLVLQWDDSWGASTHDFDVYLLDPNDYSTPLAYGTSDNITSGYPYETIYWANTTGASVTVELAINLWSGTNGSFLKYITSTDIAEYDTSSDAIDPGAASANGSLAVAAVYWNDTGLNDPEYYSSRGLKTRLFDTNGIRLSTPDIRQKPNVAGADCVSTSSNFSGGTGFGGGTFCGTSAAAPSVAGVAALILSDDPSLTPNMLYSALENSSNTVDCTLSGNPDSDCGYGFVSADNAVSWVRNNPKAKVEIGSSFLEGYIIPSASYANDSYDGQNGGPLRVTSTTGTDIVSSERVVWGVGYDEMMGYPADQLTNEYLFPWYNNKAMNSQLRVGNTGSVAADVDIYIGGVKQNNTAYNIPVGGSIRVSYTGVNGGPVRIVTNTPSATISASERVIWGVGYDELMGYSAGELTNEYLFPWYNNKAMNSQLRVGNTGSVAADVDIYIGGIKQNTSAYNIPVGGSIRVSYTGVNAGPVRVVTNTSGAIILATERVIWGNGYDELMGYPATAITNEYVFPAYSNTSRDSQLRVGNTGSVAADVDVYIGGIKQNTAPYSIPVGGSVRLSYTGVEDGPLRVVTNTAGASILATERVIYDVSASTGYDELMGYPSGSLTTEYLFPWYNNRAMQSRVLIGVP